MSHSVRPVDPSPPTGAFVQAPPPVAEPPNLARAAWEHWKKVAHAVGVVQTRVLLIVFYFIAVFPLGVILRLTGDRLHLKPPAGSNWTAHRQEPQSLETARRQF